jgi:galactose mutarotase-like enzyme
VSGPVVLETRLGDEPALTLENAAVRATVLPTIGGRVAELVDRAAGRDLLWHNPRRAARPAPYGASFDDWWSGGWDEIFPSGDLGTLHGERLPYMGELWCVPWTADASATGAEASIVTEAFGTIAPARFTRRISIRGNEPVVRLEYRIESLDVRPLPFTWGIHPAFAVTPEHRIDHPGSTMVVGVSSDPSMGVEGSTYRWARLPDPSCEGGVRDARRVRAREDAVFGGHWATGLPSGWLALTDTATRRGVAVAFDREVFPDAWLWQVYGGWRGHHHVALEPWTSRPMELEAAIAAGRARELAPGEVLVTEAAFVLFSGLEGVAQVEPTESGYRVG